MKKKLIVATIAVLFGTGVLLASSENEFGSILPNLGGLAMVWWSGRIFVKYKDELKGSFIFGEEE